MCTHFRQHEVLTRAEWMMASTGEAGSTFNRHWLVSACTLWTHHRQQKALSSVEWLMARIGDGGPALNRHLVDVSCLLGIVW